MFGVHARISLRVRNLCLKKMDCHCSLPDDVWRIVASKLVDDRHVCAYRRVNRVFYDAIAQQLLADEGDEIAAYMSAVMHTTCSDRVRERWILRRRCSKPTRTPTYVCAACHKLTITVGGCEECALDRAHADKHPFPVRRCVRGPVLAMVLTLSGLILKSYYRVRVSEIYARVR